jgi:hypothetical protein
VVTAFNTIYAGVIKDGVLITSKPAKFTMNEDGTWYSKELDLEIEWIGHVVGSIAYFSSPHIEEVREWLSANGP